MARNTNNTLLISAEHRDRIKRLGLKRGAGGEQVQVGVPGLPMSKE